MKIALVELSGSSNVPAAMNVLSSMGLPVKAIVDLDFAFRVAPSVGVIDPNHVGIASCKAILANLEAQNLLALSNDGLPKRHNGMSAAQGFAVLAQQPNAKQHIATIHDELKQHGIWVWTDGAIEEHLGLSAKNAAAWSGFLTNLQSDQDMTFAPNPASIQALCAWLDN